MKGKRRDAASLGAVLRRHPHSQPLRSKNSPAPAFHSAAEPARLALRAAYRLFLAAYRSASERLRVGDRTAIFPEGSPASSALRDPNGLTRIGPVTGHLTSTSCRSFG